LGITNVRNASPWGEFRGYQYYALAFALSQSLFTAAAAAVVVAGTAYASASALRRKGRGRGRGRGLGGTSPNWRPAVYSTCLIVLHFLYLPVNLAVFRLYYCSTGYLSADTSLECGGMQHLIFTVICSFLVFPFTVGVPIITYRIIQVHTSAFFNCNFLLLCHCRCIFCLQCARSSAGSRPFEYVAVFADTLPAPPLSLLCSTHSEGVMIILHLTQHHRMLNSVSST
jgi:hypothetical protein